MPDRPALLKVAVPVPLAETFDYAWPRAGALPPVGSRVRVPFGRRMTVGIVVDHPAATPLPPDKVKAASEQLDGEAILSAELLSTLRWAADYYHYPLGEVLSHALPAALRSGGAAHEPPAAAWRLTLSGAEVDVTALARRAPRQAAALRALRQGPLTRRECREQGVTAALLKRFAASGWIEETTVAAASHDGTGVETPDPKCATPETFERPEAPGPLETREAPDAPDTPDTPEAPDAPAAHAGAAAPALSSDQAQVVAAVRDDAGKGFRAYLLHGVTGSGKTEVYMRLIADALAAGRQTLMLVPEIGLTPQLVARLGARFGAELVVMHSGLTETARLAAWRKAHAARAKLIVGTRSAVFAPLPAAGLLIVDEEHDPSYKQQTGFRYSARDLAVLRARRLDVPVVLGSATPSLESYNNALLGRYAKLELPRRIGSAGQPTLRVVDMTKHASRQSLSTPLVAAIERHLAASGQVLLFLNRRGFAPALYCPDCKAVENCVRCDARLTVHARIGRLRCHHCGHERALQWRCAACGGERIAVGAGTQRVGDELAALFPAARIARLDRDATSRKGTLAAVLGDVASGETDILVGTQMLTKGHDFPRVTLVGVLNADQGLFGTDPRSHERLAQTLLQVAGRAGRADRPGEVLIQTHYPGHPLLATLLRQDYAAFAELALAERRAAGWPPFVHLAAWQAEAPAREAVFAFLEHAKRAAEPVARAQGVTLLGPASAVMERKDGRFRGHLLLQSADRKRLHDVLAATLAGVRASREARRVRFAVDVDPLEL